MLRPRELAQSLRKILGPEGEGWVQGSWKEDGSYCLMGAAAVAHGCDSDPDSDLSDIPDVWGEFKDVESLLLKAVHLAGATDNEDDDEIRAWDSIPEYNDYTKRNFRDVLTVLDALEKMDPANHDDDGERFLKAARDVA